VARPAGPPPTTIASTCLATGWSWARTRRRRADPFWWRLIEQSRDTRQRLPAHAGRKALAPRRAAERYGAAQADGEPCAARAPLEVPFDRPAPGCGQLAVEPAEELVELSTTITA
jgi:hypothetical protein